MVTKPITCGKIKKAKLSRAALSHIGLLIRSFAEIEDIVNLWMAKLAHSSEGILVMLLGRTPISTKMTTLENLCAIKGVAETALYKQLFGPGFKECLLCRNVVAHGIFIGKDPEGRFSFQTVEITETGPGKAARRVLSYGAEDLQGFADIAAASIPKLEVALGFSEQRKRYLRQSLEPRQKGQRSNGGSGQAYQPQASQGKPPKQSARQRRDARMQAARAAGAARTRG